MELADQLIEEYNKEVKKFEECWIKHCISSKEFNKQFIESVNGRNKEEIMLLFYKIDRASGIFLFELYDELLKSGLIET
jgi:hypothetical protein